MDTGEDSAYFAVQQALIYLTLIAVMRESALRLFLKLRSYPILMALPIWAVASALWSQSPARTIVFSSFIVISSIFALYLLERYPGEELIRLLLFVGVVALLLSYALVGLMPSAGIDYTSDAGWGWQGLFSAKNQCGIVAIYLGLTPLFLSGLSRTYRAAAYAYMAAALILVIMSQSRTAWLVLASSLVFLAILELYRRFRRLERLLLWVAVVAFVAMTAWIALSYAPLLAVSLGKSATLSGRTEIWDAILPVLWKRPALGWGYRAFFIGLKGESGALALSTGFLSLGNAENAVLQVWLEVGVIGVLLMAASLLSACRNGAYCMRRNPSRYLKWCVTIVFLNALTVIDGDKFMFANTIEWLLYVIAYVSLQDQARGLRAEQTRGGIA
jgi:O-antigen ligase